MRRVIESDLCIIGSGISAAMVAEKVAEETGARIVVVEAGDEVAPPDRRPALRQRFVDYGENPWPDDHVDGQGCAGIQSRSMQVGGQAMHWGGVTPRFSPEDFRLRTLHGIGADWPITYDDLEPFYLDAERRLGVAGEAGPPELDPRSAPYPMPPLPLSWNLTLLKEWAERSGTPFWSQPSAKNSTAYGGRPECCRNDTCAPICPIGAKYSPDYTWRALRSAGRVELIPRTLVRRLVVSEGSDRIDHAIGASRAAPDRPVEFRARVFVVAAGYIWSPHLLRISTSGRHPHGIANRSGLVGRYMTGHRSVTAYVRVPVKLYPGMNTQHSLVSRRFMRPGRQERYVRHDLRIWESSFGAEPRLRGDDGRLMLGDAILADWRARTEQGSARLRAYYDVLPDRDSGITLDPIARNPWGDPLPLLAFRDSAESAALRAQTESSIRNLFEDMVRAGGGRLVTVRPSGFQDHPAGGCRMGADPATSVVAADGRAHEHENLFVVGAPTCVTGGCANGTLTFCALALYAAASIARDLPGGSAGQPAGAARHP
ncbi:MAG: GMC family oxidoreductase [Gemmatimonadetes bacterium]|nr:GMC family oxidoreductase [Gemmatimonadota bacterium]